MRAPTEKERRYDIVNPPPDPELTPYNAASIVDLLSRLGLNPAELENIGGPVSKAMLPLGSAYRSPEARELAKRLIKVTGQATSESTGKVEMALRRLIEKYPRFFTSQVSGVRMQPELRELKRGGRRSPALGRAPFRTTPKKKAPLELDPGMEFADIRDIMSTLRHEAVHTVQETRQFDRMKSLFNDLASAAPEQRRAIIDQMKQAPEHIKLKYVEPSRAYAELEKKFGYFANPLEQRARYSSVLDALKRQNPGTPAKELAKEATKISKDAAKMDAEVIRVMKAIAEGEKAAAKARVKAMASHVQTKP
jgi:hypothetical protein